MTTLVVFASITLSIYIYLSIYLSLPFIRVRVLNIFFNAPEGCPIYFGARCS